MKILVLGATGTVGSTVVRELLSRGQQVRVLTRDPAKAAAFGAGVEVVKGDLLEPRALAPVFAGVDGVFVVNGLALSEATEGIIAVNEARAAGIQRIVYMSVQHVDRAPHLPHFGGKLGVEAAVKSSGAEWTILRPSNFHQNEVWFKDVILQHGVYPQPLGDVGVSRVDVRDIAEAAAIALTQGGHGGKTYDLIGPRPLTGVQTAEIWSETLGRKVAYGGNDLDAWEKVQLNYLPAWLVYDFKHMYAHFQKHGLAGTDAEVAILTKLLGHAPRSFEAYAQELAAEWTKESAVARS
jgi:uncharacterized protein YbjT (DUF2867 family)